MLARRLKTGIKKALGWRSEPSFFMELAVTLMVI